MIEDSEIIRTNTPRPDSMVLAISPDPVIAVVLDIENKRIRATMSADKIYDMASKSIAKMLAMGVEEGENKALALLIRTAVKGVLLMYGHKIIDLQWKGEGSPPRPGKKDDLLIWYSDFFTQIFIATMARQELHLEGDSIKNDSEDSISVTISNVYAKPCPY